MENNVYLEAYAISKSNDGIINLQLPLESLITYSIYKYCAPEQVSLKFLRAEKNDRKVVTLSLSHDVGFVFIEHVPWQVSLCIYPVVMCDDIVITGICAVVRHICKYRSSSVSPHEHVEGLLGFRKNCLQAPNEASIWTKFCEIDIVNSVEKVLDEELITQMPVELMKFENHLKKPVKIHNVYKIARDMKKVSINNATINENLESPDNLIAKENQVELQKKLRIPKTRKWKSNIKKEIQIDCSVEIEDLDLSHQFAEGPFLTLADLVLLPSYHILFKAFDKHTHLLPLTAKWLKNIKAIPEMKIVTNLLDSVQLKITQINDVLIVPETEDVSLYKSDPKRHNPKKRLYTKENDIENALSTLLNGMEMNIVNKCYKHKIEMDDIPDGANPTAGHLPDARMHRKFQQLENLAQAVLSLAKDGDRIVDFCSGSGHLGILLAYLLPKCTFILLENKEQSLLRARKRIHDMGLKNVYFYQCNLDFFIGKFDVGIALHACGIATDLVLDKCLKVYAKFVMCPCCYGSLHTTNRLVYPRSNMFSSIAIDKYLCIGHAADQTHEDHPLTERGSRCMSIIDSDRGRLAEEFGFTVTLSKLQPLTCTPKNNLLIGVPPSTNNS